MSSGLQSSLSKCVWRILSYSGGRHCKIMSSYRRSEGPSLGVTEFRWSRHRSSCRENHRDLHLTAFSPFLIPGAPLARPRASSHRTSRVELPCVLPMPYSVLSCFPFTQDRESWAGYRKEEDAERIIICIILTLASGHLIVVQS